MPMHIPCKCLKDFVFLTLLLLYPPFSSSVIVPQPPLSSPLPVPHPFCSYRPRVCHSVGTAGSFVGAAEEVSHSGGANSIGKGAESLFHAVFPARAPVHPSGSGRGSCHPCMWALEACTVSFSDHLTVPSCVLRTDLLMLMSRSCLAGSLISFQLTPTHLRGISLHFLTLSYGGGCFLGAFIIQLLYLLSAGKFTNIYPSLFFFCILRFFFTLSCIWIVFCIHNIYEWIV